MTKQTYRDILEALQEENYALKKEIRELKKPQPDVFDNRPLDEIVQGYRGANQVEEAEPFSFKREKKKTPVSGDLSGFMDKYREYRRMIKEENALYENEIVMDVSALDELRNSVLCEKPA